ncbi:hypothetical protein [Streptomyces sp. NBC_01320]|uniref:hypothetical protein n=1 Tax=Streptomyces sp. NBC_01320 TaxID=2903824 RepID=UPI002E141CE4|nr:hypothetical protein OG395_56435 [Streptomyces sp. NBC_01320]
MRAGRGRGGGPLFGIRLYGDRCQGLTGVARHYGHYNRATHGRSASGDHRGEFA